MKIRRGAKVKFHAFSTVAMDAGEYIAT